MTQSGVKPEKIRACDRKNARAVARRLLGIREFRVIRESTKYPNAWFTVKKFSTRADAEEYTKTHAEYVWYIEEFFG